MVTRGFTSEMKFVLDASAGREVARWARSHLVPDTYGSGPHGDEYRVTSVYFDTVASDVFHRRGSYGRSKYRIRRYQDERTAFLERKLRTSALLAKRRTRVHLDALPLLANPADPDDPAGWFERRIRVRRLRPVCQVSYARLARQTESSGDPARLTLDDGLATLATDAFSFVADPGKQMLQGEMILELKYRSHIPAAFKDLVNDFRLNPRPASKYRLAVEALGLAGMRA